jgi:hypothetical protein
MSGRRMRWDQLTHAGKPKTCVKAESDFLARDRASRWLVAVKKRLRRKRGKQTKGGTWMKQDRGNKTKAAPITRKQRRARASLGRIGTGQDRFH